MKFVLTLVGFVLAATMSIQAESLLGIPLKDIDGEKTSLKAYEGKVMLLVNVASECGLTPQYKGLQKIHTQFKDQGFTVLGFPCNDFGAQEPGTNEEIKAFCSSRYQVSFPMFDKIHVKGDEQHPLYTALTGKKSPFPGDVEWNFGKFLVGPTGEIVKRFSPRVKPESDDVVSAIKAELGKR